MTGVPGLSTEGNLVAIAFGIYCWSMNMDPKSTVVGSAFSDPSLAGSLAFMPT